MFDLACHLARRPAVDHLPALRVGAELGRLPIVGNLARNQRRLVLLWFGGSNSIRVPFLGTFRDLFGTVPLSELYRFRYSFEMQPVELDLAGITAPFAAVLDKLQGLQVGKAGDDGFAVQARELGYPGGRRIGAVDFLVVAIGEREQDKLAACRAGSALGGPCERGEAHSTAPVTPPRVQS